MHIKDPSARLGMNSATEQIVIIDYTSNSHGNTSRNLRSALILLDKCNGKRWLIDVSIGNDARHSIETTLNVWENGAGWTRWLSLVPGDNRVEDILARHASTVTPQDQLSILDATMLLLIEDIRRARDAYPPLHR